MSKSDFPIKLHTFEIRGMRKAPEGKYQNLELLCLQRNRIKSVLSPAGVHVIYRSTRMLFEPKLQMHRISLITTRVRTLFENGFD